MLWTIFVILPVVLAVIVLVIQLISGTQGRLTGAGPIVAGRAPATLWSNPRDTVLNSILSALADSR
jgi:hypothetical protein